MGNNAKPKGSIVKKYALKEALGFCSELFGGLYSHRTLSVG
jgi:hypothetical protein